MAKWQWDRMCERRMCGMEEKKKEEKKRKKLIVESCSVAIIASIMVNTRSKHD